MEDKVRLQLRFDEESCRMLDEMCVAHALTRSAMCKIALRKYYVNDELTAQMRDKRKRPKRG